MLLRPRTTMSSHERREVRHASSLRDERKDKGRHKHLGEVARDNVILSKENQKLKREISSLRVELARANKRQRILEEEVLEKEKGIRALRDVSQRTWSKVGEMFERKAAACRTM
jgi:predicted  nucleic acid-binding Zn-ribbon protein